MSLPNQPFILIDKNSMSEAIASTSRVEAIATRVEAIANRNKEKRKGRKGFLYARVSERLWVKTGGTLVDHGN